MNIKKYLKKPSYILEYLSAKGLLNWMNDKVYIKLIYKIEFGKKLNLKNPQTFNEKMNYLKIYDRNLKYSSLADKKLVKEYVSNLIGDEYVIETYNSWTNTDVMNIDDLPDEFVLKCNHDSNGVIICRDKNNFDLDEAKRRLEKSLKKNYYYQLREWPYKNIKPQIIAEKFIEDTDSDDLRDYKFLCFNGEPKYVYVTVKNDNIYENYYDLNFNVVDINHGFPRHVPEFKKPKNFNKMIEIVKRLSYGIPFIRIDLHNVNGKIYFGEFTFYDWGAMRPYINEDIDLKLGNMLDIKKTTNNKI